MQTFDPVPCLVSSHDFSGPYEASGKARFAVNGRSPLQEPQHREKLHMARPPGACIRCYYGVALLGNTVSIPAGTRLVLAPDTGSESVRTGETGHIPLYRSSVGFDRIASLLDSLTKADQSQPSYPPYNIELTGEDQCRISLAVAGFDQSDLEIEAEQNQLTVRGKRPGQEGGKYLHRGIATRAFERRFQLADHVRVENARYENGLLHIELVREVPEKMKPRTIEISTASPAVESTGDAA
jgi:molecular chaperone IbpA